MRVSFLAVAILFLFGAGTFNSHARSGDVGGPFASRISAADLAQIKAAVSNERGISHTVKKIEAVRPDKVLVQTYTRSAVDQDTTYDFSVSKQKRGWVLDPNSIQVSIEQRDFRTNGPSIIR